MLLFSLFVSSKDQPYVGLGFFKPVFANFLQKSVENYSEIICTQHAATDYSSVFRILSRTIMYMIIFHIEIYY